MLVRHLGGKVQSNADGSTEIGWYPLRPTEKGRLLMHWPKMVYHFHREGFDLPHGAHLLAEGDTYPNQAFRYNGNAWALQFHARAHPRDDASLGRPPAPTASFCRTRSRDGNIWRAACSSMPRSRRG